MAASGRPPKQSLPRALPFVLVKNLEDWNQVDTIPQCVFGKNRKPNDKTN